MQKLLAFGLVILLSGIGLLVVGTTTQGNVSTGGVIFIGPFPIVFGSGPSGTTLALGSVLIGAVMLVLLFIWGWRFSKVKRE